MGISDLTKSTIKSLSPETLASRGVITAAKTGYICPACGNGEGKSGTGIKPEMLGDVWTYHCFKCGASFDNISLLARHYNLDNDSDFNEICRRACDDFGINADFEPIPSAAGSDKQSRATSSSEPDPAELKAKETELIRADILEAQKRLSDLPVDARRGLSLETLQHFHCGYLPDWTAPKIRAAEDKVPASRRLIVPSSWKHYLASAIDRDGVEKKYHKMHAGNKELFNSTALKSGGVVVIVEGEVDAMSIWQATGGAVPVVALGGAAEDKWTSSLPEKAQFLILFDNDDTGRLKAGTLRETLIQRGYPAAVAFLSSGNEKIDANDILRLYRDGNERLAVKIKELLNFAQDDLRKAAVEIKRLQLQKSNPAAAAIFGDFQQSNEADYFANEFEVNRQRRRQFSNRKTGFENLDAVQSFLPGLYILGGLPGIGKTSFAMQLAEQCAAAGENVLYISYEMDVDFLRAKSIARELFLRDPFTTLTAARIASGDTNSAVEEIVSSRKKSARNFRIIRTNATMTNLLAALEVELSLFDKPPIIFVDYLQRIPVDSNERRDGVAKNVYALKDFQQRHDATIFLLSSLNRDNYSAPISFESFKETGDIEYSADVVMGLQLYAVNGFTNSAANNRQMSKRAHKHQPREMELICVKNRFGNLYDVFFNYFSAHDHFTPFMHEPKTGYYFSNDFNPAHDDNDTGNDSSELDGDGEEESEVAQNSGGGNWSALQDGTRVYSSNSNANRGLSEVFGEDADRHFHKNHPNFKQEHPELYRES